MQEKVKHGLQNDKEIVEVLDRFENKLETLKSSFFFPSLLGRSTVFPLQKDHYFR